MSEKLEIDETTNLQNELQKVPVRDEPPLWDKIRNVRIKMFC
jgi:hypothetical protein